MKGKKNKISDEEFLRRLDVIIRLLIELNKKLDEKFDMATIVKILKSLGLAPTEIAKILGYKSRTSVASFLYSKKKGKEI